MSVTAPEKGRHASQLRCGDAALDAGANTPNMGYAGLVSQSARMEY